VNVWGTLVAKEFRMNRTTAIGLSSIVVVMAAGLMVGLAIDPGTRLVVWSITFLALAAVVHVFLIPVHVLRLLRREWRRTAAVWLQTPVSGWALLGAKLLVAAAYMTASWVVLSVAGYVLGRMIVGSPQLVGSLGPVNLAHLASIRAGFGSLFLGFVFWGWLTSLAVGLYIAAWITLVILTLHATRYRLGRGGIVAAVAVALIPLWGLPALSAIPAYDRLMKLGTVRLLVGVHRFAHTGVTYVTVPVVGRLVFYGVVGVLVMVVGAWLLDRKVEV
jgi:hypothetical protein